MKKKCFIYVLIIISFNNLYCQEKKLCKSWKVDFISSNNVKRELTEEEKNYKIIFYENHKFEEIENGSYIYGKWKLDNKKRKITLESQEIPVDLIFKLIKLDNNVFIFETKDDKGKKIVMTMKAIEI